ncbi:MAG: ComEC/Rec2 family competence protein, partial [Candidatus Sericytochromatia bacterium]
AEPLLTGTRSDLNNNSIITKWTYGSFSVLMTGDVEAEGLDRLVKSGANLQSTVLKVPHHGSRYTMNAAFLARVKPKVAVVSAGKGNDYKHPHKEAMTRLAKVGAHTHVTAQRGTITVTSNGRGFELKAER